MRILHVFELQWCVLVDQTVRILLYLNKSHVYKIYNDVVVMFIVIV